MTSHVAPRDSGARTITVETGHFSDWALTWQTTDAAAEGDIALDQTVGPALNQTISPGLHATGRAALFFLGDDAYDTSYVMTGTLTLSPATFQLDGVECTVAEPTVSLPVSIAEVHKDAPPVFRWGIGANWTATCGGRTEVVPARFDTMFINLTGCPGGYSSGQIVAPDRDTPGTSASV